MIAPAVALTAVTPATAMAIKIQRCLKSLEAAATSACAAEHEVDKQPA
jgi:hypothetical protein